MAENTPMTVVAGVGVADLEFTERDLTSMATLAGAALACMAAIGNGDPAMVEQALRAVIVEQERLSTQGRRNLEMLADEVLEAGRGGKMFMLLGKVRVTDTPEPATGATLN